MEEFTKQEISSVIGSPRRAATEVVRMFADAELRGLLFFVAVLLAIGVVFYTIVEGWDLLEAFYFSVATLTTLGYGDLHPTNDVSRLFTAFYVLVGLGFLLSTVTRIARLANRPVIKRFNGSHKRKRV